MSVIFVFEAIVTSGEDGFLYVWDENKISTKLRAHPEAQILSLNSTKDSSIFASGGKDGRVVLWLLGRDEF